jgi:hypothetical protein
MGIDNLPLAEFLCTTIDFSYDWWIEPVISWGGNESDYWKLLEA